MRGGTALIQAAVLVPVALLVFLFLRGFWLDRYVVSSDSMEPTLHGHPERGDRVLVDKSTSASWVPERGDLVVMRNPESPDSFLVKRVVARGGERVRLMYGDVFLWDRGRGDWHRWEKDPLQFRDMRMTYFERPGGGEAPHGDFLRGGADPAANAVLELPAAAVDLDGLRALLVGDLAGHRGTAYAVDARFVDSQGNLRGEALPCQDVGMEVDVQPESGLVGLQLVFEHRGHFYAWSYGVTGEVQFHADGAPLGVAVRAEPLTPRRSTRIEFGYLDGSFFLIAGDRLCGSWPIELELFADPTLPLGAEPNNLLHVAAAGAGARVTRLRVFHDVYYETLDIPFQDGDIDVPIGELWLLGDNTFDSRDSRSRGGFPRTDLVGRPVAILGPPARFRVLPR